MRISARIERVVTARPVAVSRGTYAGHDIVVVTIVDGDHVGHGECCALEHYGLSAQGTVAEIEAVAGKMSRNTTRNDLLALMPPGPARNGLDCALWDLEAKRAGVSAWTLAGVAQPTHVATAMTLVLAAPEDMAAQARRWSDHATLKLKLGSDNAEACIRAVRAARPDARLSIDANEAWSREQFEALWPALAAAKVELIEQPLRAAEDDLIPRGAPAPVCADESFHSFSDIERMRDRFDYVNIKLDKCGGLTEALRIIEAAPVYGLRCMVGCMFATSLAIAPALIAASSCDFADLDGPLHLAADRADGFKIVGGGYDTHSSQLWGQPA